MVVIPPSSAPRPARKLLARAVLSATCAALAVLAMCAVPAFAGQASTGELLFYPCTSCHPLHTIPGTERATKPLPNNFAGHQIVLEGHDVLGAGHAACPVCHDDQTRNPGMLKTVDGTLTDIKTGNIAAVCERCHEDKYRDWKAGTHGKHKPSCVAAGCHDPHTPQFIYAAPLTPFIGTGFQFQVLPQRVAFRPLAPPAPSPATIIPGWFTLMALLGFVVVAGLVGTLASGRFKR